MSIATFVRDAGERIVANAKAAFQLHPGKDKKEEKQSAPPDAAPNSGSAGEAIANYIRAQNLKIDELQVSFDAASSTVKVSGVADDQATKEKVILCCGNVAGVERVDENITVRKAQPQAQFHTVVSGDTLSAIAKKYYGNANKYNEIFEANQPMLKHPDKIYPGQSLRIPPLEGQ